MHITTTPACFSWSTIATGTPSPAINALAPSSMIIVDGVAVSVSGCAVSRSTPNGLSVSSRTRRICWRIRSGPTPGHAERAEAARLADRGADLGVGHAAHAGEQDRMLDAEQVADRGADAHYRPSVMKTR